MTAKEIIELIFSNTLFIAFFTLISGFFLNHFLVEWKKKKVFYIINAIILLLYSIYFINGRIYHSEYGGALVWELYFYFIVLFHFVVLLIFAIVKSYTLKTKLPDLDQKSEQKLMKKN
ncbi:hypothetical protein HNQ92_002143 [Rhabdobacter roseus]|uniref:Uncharacterized protein n=1 Tax=Rhabdobacter roseus TaxID=1655419 RepID=A0A840TVL8_9BACT|nr:hypothetical protein [Rhabdobacter roseus]